MTTKNDETREEDSQYAAPVATAATAVAGSDQWCLGRFALTHYHPTRVWECDVEEAGVTVATTYGESLAEATTFAEDIIQCVNAHHDLLAALKAIVSADDAKSLAMIVEAMPAARAAIAKAEAR